MIEEGSKMQFSIGDLSYERRIVVTELGNNFIPLSPQAKSLPSMSIGMKRVAMKRDLVNYKTTLAIVDRHTSVYLRIQE